ncbi:MAG: YkgJ family cysteine cluster protein [Gammaproteobacteria bacterium]|nr:YkgJ family cysteine cluster protein [Gammaproteobacteria bacterium]
MSDIKIEDIPFKSEVMPAVLDPNAEIKFKCHKGISCWNACCKQADITLTPYDILRLKQATGKDSSGVLKDHTVPFTMDADGVPGIKLRTTDEGTCLFMDEETGCTIYENRPTACRYYPLGNLSLKKADQAHENQHFVLVKEDHCKGHEEDRGINIQDYRAEQKVEDYDQHNIEYFQLILKKKSMGPGVGKPPEMSLQLFFMAAYDQDRFRRFVLSDAFKNNYTLDDKTYDDIANDDVACLYFGYRLLRQVLFNEKTIAEVDGALEKRAEERKEVIEMRRKLEIEKSKSNDPYLSYKLEVEEEKKRDDKEK